MYDFPSALTWEAYYEKLMRLVFWQMFVFVGLNAGSKKRTIVGGRPICLQTKPKNIIHYDVIQTPFHGCRQSKGIVLRNNVLG